MMSSALFYLVLTALLTTLIWLPGGIQLLLGQGMGKLFGNRDNISPLAPWAERSKRAHGNAVENLAVFATLVLVAHVTGRVTEMVNTAAMVFFWMRVLHYFTYTFGIIYVRSAVWTVGWVCMLVIAWQLLGA